MPIEKATPPAPAARKKTAAVAATPRISRREAREAAINEVGGAVSLIAVMKGWFADAGAIAAHGPKFASEMALVAESDEHVATWLDYLTQSGPWLGATKALLPLILQLAANHGRIDATKLPPDAGILEPKLLEERVRAEMRNASARVMAEIRQMEQQTEEMQRTILREAM